MFFVRELLFHTVVTMAFAYWSFARTRQGFFSKCLAFLAPPLLLAGFFWLVFA